MVSKLPIIWKQTVSSAVANHSFIVLVVPGDRESLAIPLGWILGLMSSDDTDVWLTKRPVRRAEHQGLSQVPISHSGQWTPYQKGRQASSRGIIYVRVRVQLIGHARNNM